VGAVVVGAVGAALGSFAGVVADRVPRGESLGGRSHCVCGQQIAARDNVPIVGYLARRGRARCCGARIPWWFPAMELAGAVVAVGLYLLIAT
jgi:prepilin signal peptidase PulO-like enzyme (type II secretory pathway)